MNKLILTLSTVFLCSLDVAAQSGYFFENNIAQGTAGKTTGMESRLIGLTQWTPQGNVMTPQDSFYYAYSGNNGWGFALGDWKFDSCMHVMSPGTTAMEYTHRLINTFDAQKRIAEQLRESFSLGKFYLSRKTLYTYTATGNLAIEEMLDNSPGGWSPYLKTINSYDNNGELTERIYQFVNHLDVLRNYSREIRNYDVNDLLTSQTYYKWDTVANKWNETQRKTFTYSGKKLIITLDEVYSGGWKSNNLTSYIHDANGNLIEDEVKHYAGGTWWIYRKHIYTYDAAGNQTSMLTLADYNGVYKNYEKTITGYNSFGQPLISTYQTAYTSGGSIFKTEYKNYYYYEQVFNGVRDMSARQVTLQVYPNPARNTLILNLNTAEMNGATIMLLDITGKVMGQWAAMQHMQTLDVSNIPSGTYMLKLMGNKGVLNQQVNIVK